MKSPLSRQDLVELVTKIINCEGSEEQVDKWLELAEENVPHPRLSDLIYYSEEEKSPEQIVDEALAYTPFAL